MPATRPQPRPFARLGPQPNDFALMESAINPRLAPPEQFDKFEDLTPDSDYWDRQANAFRTMSVPNSLARPVISTDLNEVVMEDVGFMVDEDGKPIGNVRPIAAMPSKQRKIRQSWRTAEAMRQQQQQQTLPPVVSLARAVEVEDMDDEQADDAEASPKKTLLQQVSNHIKGTVYDLAHFQDLPGDGAGAKLKYACTRDNRLWTLVGLILCVILCICVVVAIALLIKKAVSKKQVGGVRG